MNVPSHNSVRIPKYRGRDPITGQWHYGGVVASQHYVELVTFPHTPQSNWHHVEKETLGQYTGINDKNGREIYEGDLLRDSLGHIYQVVWKHIGFELIGRVPKRYPVRMSDPSRWSEVIGNIHDNDIENIGITGNPNASKGYVDRSLRM